MDVLALLVIVFGVVTMLYAACWVFVLRRRASGNSARVVLMRFERIVHPLIWIATLTASAWIISGCTPKPPGWVQPEGERAIPSTTHEHLGWIDLESRSGTSTALPIRKG